MSARAYLPSDYNNDAINALEGIREVLRRRYDQASIAAREHNKASDFLKFEAAFGMMQAFHAALDDVALAIQKEQAR